MNYSVIIACMVAMATASATAGALVTPNAIRYWEETVPTSGFPWTLKAMVSPLNTEQEILYQNKLNNHEKIAGLCSSGKLYCDAMEFDKFRTMKKSCTSYSRAFDVKPTAEFAMKKGLFFKENQLIQQRGGELVVDLREYQRTTPATRFLPRGLESQLEEDTSQLLGIPPSSQLAKETAETAARCATAGHNSLTGDEAFCVSSIEDLADRLSSTALKRGASGTWQMLEVSGDNSVKAKLLHAELATDTGIGGSAYLSCHSMTSPYAKYYCHHMDNTRVYRVTLQTLGANPAVVNVVAICHMDTSQWHPAYPAFSDLKSSPGKTEACHFTNADGLVFVTAK